MAPAIVSFWILVRTAFVVVGSIAAIAAIIGISAFMLGKKVLSGAVTFDEFVRWHWGDLDEATAVLRTRVHLYSVALIVGLALLSFGIFGERFIGGTLFVSCIAFFVLIVWRWLERELAWPGWFVPREVRGTRGLSAARKEGRRQVQEADGGEHTHRRSDRPDDE